MTYKFDFTGAEIIGQALLGYLDHMEIENTRPFLAKHRIEENVKSDGWYPAENVVAFLRDVAQHENGMYSLVSIGIESTKHLLLPPEWEQMPFPEFCEKALPLAYKIQSRGGELGFIRGEKITENHVKVTCVTPLPDDGWYGSLYGLARRFLPPGTAFRVEYDKAIPRRDEGGSETVIHISW